MSGHQRHTSTEDSPYISTENDMATGKVDVSQSAPSPEGPFMARAAPGEFDEVDLDDSPRSSNSDESELVEVDEWADLVRRSEEAFGSIQDDPGSPVRDSNSLPFDDGEWVYVSGNVSGDTDVPRGPGRALTFGPYQQERYRVEEEPTMEERVTDAYRGARLAIRRGIRATAPTVTSAVEAVTGGVEVARDVVGGLWNQEMPGFAAGMRDTWRLMQMTARALPPLDGGPRRGRRF